MGRSCAICNSKYAKSSSKSFHSFPKNMELRVQWCQIIGFRVEALTRHTFLCSDHFSTEDIHSHPSGLKYLDKKAIPKVNRESSSSSVITLSEDSENPEEAIPSTSFSSLLKGKTIKRKRNVLDITSSDSDKNITKRFKPKTQESLTMLENSSEVPIISVKSSCSKQADTSGTLTASEGEREKAKIALRRKPLPHHFGGFSSDDMRSPRKARQSFHISNKMIQQQRAIITKLKRDNKRLTKKVQYYKQLFLYLQENKYLSKSAETIIEKKFPEAPKLLMQRMMQGSSKQKYPPELRAFALTLSFYSMKAYRYVREKFNSCLPHPDTISRWYHSIDGSPGFSVESLRAIKIKVAEHAELGMKFICNIVMDEMAIMQRVQWTGKKFTGYVDYGASIEADNTEATEALAFMLVAINGHWKIPVAYFLVNKLKGHEKANLLQELLRFVHESGVIVTSITFDGAQSNLNMARCLGAEINDALNLKTHFPHPATDEPVYIFLDACHMTKLWRNCLGDQKILKDGDGRSIEWNFFENLVQFQESQGLHVGTKIRKRHVNYHNEKQKVRLAVQTLSNSVAVALNYLDKDLKIDSFENSEGTVEFCKIANNIFDIFNSRSKYSKYPFKRGITDSNKDEIFNYLDYCKKYILSLNLHGNSILLSRRKTGFLGYLISIESLQSLYHNYVSCNTPLLKYVLSYKLSQDHIEVYFSSVRSYFGFNNNPTAQQFEAIYKRLLVHTEIKGSNFANATALDNTTILSVSSVTKSSLGENFEQCEEYIEMVETCEDHDYINSASWHLTVFVEDVVEYMSGFVVKCLKKCVICIDCLDLLEDEETYSILQKRKKFGELINASKFVIAVCKTAEAYWRLYMSQNNLFSRDANVVNKLIGGTIRNLEQSIFTYSSRHVSDDDPLNEHPLLLIKLILKNYFKIRIHHETFKLKDKVTSRVRSVLTKSILFKNQ